MPEGYITLVADGEQARRHAALLKAWEDGGRVGLHPLSRQARFERGEPVAPAIHIANPTSRFAR